MHTARMDSPLLHGAIMSPVSHTMKLSEALRQLGHPVAYYPTLSKVFGMQEAVFIAQFVYWTGKGSNPDGWIYKSASEIQEETGLTYEQQQRVRKVLGSSTRYGVRGKRVRRVHFEQIIEEKYERTEHRMYFRVNMEALDRAFSENLFSGLHSGAVGYYPSALVGNTQVPVGYYPVRLLSETTAETTYKDIVRKEAHKKFVAFFCEMAVTLRKNPATLDKAGFRNLRIALKLIDEETLERLCLYYLADSKFEEYATDLKVFLSGGVMKALADQERKDGFVKRMEGYMDRYLAVNHPNDLRLGLASDIRLLAQKFSA